MTSAWQLRPGILSRAAIDGVAGPGGGGPTPGTVVRSAMTAEAFINATAPSREGNVNGVMVNM